MAKGRKPAVLVALALLLAVSNAAAQHVHGHDPSEELGRVAFKTSCSPAAQKQFNRAVAWLHSFEYEEAEKAFNGVIVTDPRCGIAYWGIAMSNYYPLWTPPTPDQLRKGSTAVEKAKL